MPVKYRTKHGFCSANGLICAIQEIKHNVSTKAFHMFSVTGNVKKSLFLSVHSKETKHKKAMNLSICFLCNSHGQSSNASLWKVGNPLTKQDKNTGNNSFHFPILLFLVLSLPSVIPQKP